MNTTLIVVLSILVVAFGAFAILDATRGTPVSRVMARDGEEIPAITDPLFPAIFEATTGVALRPGHEAELVVNGDGIYPRLWDDLRAARTYIAIQMYYWQSGRVCDELRDILLERRRAGVEVLVLHDAFGASALPRDYMKALRAGGIEVATFRGFRLAHLHALQHRAHVRAIVIDGATGWTGGFGFDDKWLGDGTSTDGKDGWRDSAVRFTGPAVASLLGVFTSCWAEATGELLAGARHWATAARTVGDAGSPGAGTPLAGVLHAMPTVGSTPAERFVALAVAGVRTRLWITTAYFVADDDFRRLVKEAAGRGADVRLLTAGEASDVRSTRYAARARYHELLEGGVRIWEYQPAMIHAKTMVADGAWATVGTLNLDNRSMAFNNECTYVAFDGTFAAALERQYEADLARSKEIDLVTWRRRPLWRKVLEHAAHRVSRIL